LTGDLGLYVNAGRVKQNELESECESESESESESSFTYVCISTLHLDAYANKHGELREPFQMHGVGWNGLYGECDSITAAAAQLGIKLQNKFYYWNWKSKKLSPAQPPWQMGKISKI